MTFQTLKIETLGISLPQYFNVNSTNLPYSYPSSPNIPPISSLRNSPFLTNLLLSRILKRSLRIRFQNIILRIVGFIFREVGARSGVCFAAAGERGALFVVLFGGVGGLGGVVR